MELLTTPGGLSCSRCDTAIEFGYFPAVERAESTNPCPTRPGC
jgi:hypothetical protein